MSLLMVLALACGGRDGDPIDSDVPEGEDTDPVEIPDDNIGSFTDACEPGFREPDEYPNQLIGGAEMQRYTLRDPQAVCNDGTPAVMYVRAATDDALANVWSIHLQGGGACNGYEECFARWCGTDYYDASKMSSAYAPPEIGALGIYDSDPGNVLAGANHAFLYYCSSDGWVGQGTRRYEAEGEATFSTFRHGHHILAGAIDELLAGAVADGGEAMPPLAEATIVLLSGTSGGSIGVVHSADWVASQLAANGTVTYAVADAGHAPLTELLPADVQTLAEGLFANLWEMGRDVDGDPPYADESCMAHLGGTADEYRCGETAYVIANHVTTPFFIRQDLRDINELGEIAGIAEDDYEVLIQDTLLAYADIQSTAVEGDDIDVVPGVYGPNCAQHVALETNPWWREATVEDAAGTPYTFQQAVARWYQGAAVQIIDDPVTGAGNGPGSDCSAVDDER